MRATLAVLILCFALNANASRTMQFQVYAPPLPNNARPDMGLDETLVSGYEVSINLSNPSNIDQPGTVEVLGAQSNINVDFIQDNGGGGYNLLKGNYVSYVCGSTGGTSGNASGSNTSTPTWPAKQNFMIPKLGARTLTVGVLFYKALTAGDNVKQTNGIFIPTILLTLNQDAGAVSGYAISLNRTFSVAAYTICSGAGAMPTSPKLVSSAAWGYAPGIPRELNGGRPF